MSNTPPGSIDRFPAFLARFPPHVDLEGLARETKAFQRPRGVRSGTDLMRLALARGPGSCLHPVRPRASGPIRVNPAGYDNGEQQRAIGGPTWVIGRPCSGFLAFAACGSP